MSKLQHEIASNKARLNNADDKKAQRKILVDSLLDTVSGGWINAFANWTKRI
ncbi:putative rSAM-modified RiPP (XyeA family) [Erwinia toletana]|uniref:RSAM-modified RiPP (XyeA family) n=1 Tax=Winslowiella toletana TaxID=92490 RepID=A0ABS4PC01_9GAMM|nr:XyeA family cyclophane-containing RiPP triceptide [Winslowiella toletana]MBP2169601.1 putative rSAM-modified RiPP (XyeA family) [Winslowiella toletana]